MFMKALGSIVSRGQYCDLMSRDEISAMA